ncbi:MAG: CDP-alcohol phosphatidyltransferase family protein, partial [Candidatus Poribacteria bacterium]|nr:CDP-alcohol phosphatidyltransferase family protein [Candidatus Poribacteria bacterium]
MPRVQDVTTSADSYNISSAHFLYLSNLLSLFRIIAVPFVFWGLVEQNRWLVFGVGGTAVVTDTLDGLIARKLDQQSDLGRL